MAWFWPVSGTITQTPHTGHMAYDIGVPQGTPVIAPVDSVVERIDPADPYGYGMLMVLRTRDQRIYLAHNSSFLEGLKPGTPVKAGQVVSISGNTGHSTGPHVHFEIRDVRTNKSIDPNPFIGGANVNDRVRAPAPTRARAPVASAPAMAPVTNSAPGINPNAVIAALNAQGANTVNSANRIGTALNNLANATARNAIPWQKPQGTPILNTPVGPITVPKFRFSWATVGAMATGIALVVFSLPKVLDPAADKRKEEQRQLAEQVAPAILGAANPALGLAAEAAVAVDKKQVAKKAARKAAGEIRKQQRERAREIPAPAPVPVRRNPERRAARLAAQFKSEPIAAPEEGG